MHYVLSYLKPLSSENFSTCKNSWTWSSTRTRHLKGSIWCIIPFWITPWICFPETVPQPIHPEAFLMICNWASSFQVGFKSFPMGIWQWFPCLCLYFLQRMEDSAILWILGGKGRRTKKKWSVFSWCFLPNQVYINEKFCYL